MKRTIFTVCRTCIVQRRHGTEMMGIRINAKLRKTAPRYALLFLLLFACLALSPSETAAEVPFLKQWPDGYVAGNMNCGPACCVMVSAALRGKTPSVVDLKGTLDFLKGDHRQYQGKLEGYWHTDLVSALSGYFGFSDAGWACGKGLEVLKPYLDKGIPIIANVSQVFDPNKPNHRYSLTDHWIVVEGYDRDSVQIADPGRSLEANGRGQYTINEFDAIFYGTFVYPMTTTVVQQQTIQDEPANILDLSMIKRLLNMKRSEIINLMGSSFVNDHVTDYISGPYTLIFWSDELPLQQIIFLGSGTPIDSLYVGKTVRQVEESLGVSLTYFTYTGEEEDIIYMWGGSKNGLWIMVHTSLQSKEDLVHGMTFSLD